MGASSTAKWGWFALFLLVTLLTAWPVVASERSDSATAAVEQAWRRASAANRFHFDTTTTQITHLTAHPDNIGRRSTTANFDISGDIDRPAESLDLQLWPYGRERDQSFQMRLQDGRAWGRASVDSEWTTLDNAAELFVENGPPLGYLIAAENVHILGRGEVGALFPDALLPDVLAGSVTRYRFDLNGLEYARYMRRMMEAELQRSGVLPAGVSLDLVREYVDMEGEGELWLDADGLPYRQLLHLRFPADDHDREWIELRVVVDYSDWQSRAADLASLDWSQPGAALQTALLQKGISRDDILQTLAALGYTLLLCGAAVLLVSRRQVRPVQFAVAATLIVAFLLTPLLQSHRVEAFLARRAAADPTADVTAESAAVDSVAFQPNVSPLASTDAEVVPAPAVALATAACDVGESSDCDGDGLQDKVEIFELGTLADAVDTDNDGISDGIEVIGFSVGGQTWYLNPRDPDSNHDGRPDGLECAARHNVSSDGIIDASVTAVTCPDTDQDGVPDVWDYDDDKDGVPDAVDGAPQSFHSVVDQQFGLALAGYQKEKSLFVDVTVRPTNDEHLWWTNSYLDWPDLDQHGQITRVTDETLGDDGDMMLSPLLEITIPFSSANPSRGLPVKSGVNAAAITATDPIANWLDTGTLDLYGLTVNQDGGTLVVYAPLNVTRDIVGDTPVAWHTRLYYEMPSASTGWGEDHEMKVLWTINGVLDQCTLPEGQTFATYCDVGNNGENTANLAHWTTSQTVYQTYYDDFIVTSLTVHEEHGVDAAVMAQKPGASGANAHYDNYLWHMADTLEETFLQAQLINGQRMSVADIGSQYPNWGIPAAAISYEHLTGLANTTELLDALSGDATISRLNAIYPSASKGDTATLLFSGDKTIRAVGLDEMVTSAEQTAAGSSFTLDLSSATAATTGFLRWEPYSYDGATWSNMDLVAYRDQLQTELAPVFSTSVVQGLAASDTGYDAATAEHGAVILAVNFYSSLYSGAVTLLQSGSTVFSNGNLMNSDHALTAEPAVSVVSELLDDVQNFYLRISLSNLTLTATLYDELEAVAATSWATLAQQRGHIMEALGHLVLGDASTSTTLGLTQLQYAPQILGDLTTLLNAGALDYTFMSTVSEARSHGPLANDIALTYYVAYRGVYKIRSAYRLFSGVVPSVPDLLRSMITDYQTWLWMGYAGDVGVAIGSFALAWGEGKITPGSPEFAEKLAFEISTIIVRTVILVITTVATGGLVLGALAVLSIIDALAALICDAVGVKPGSATDQWICGGLTGALVKALTYVINDYTELADLTHDGRLDNDMSTPTVTQNTTTPGFAAGNTINLATTITSTLYFGKPNWMGYVYASTQLIDDNLDDSTFQYQLQRETSDIHLDLNGTTWEAIGGGGLDNGIPTGARFRNTSSTSLAYVIAADETGVNTGLNVSLAEGYAMKAQDCWLIGQPVCWIETTRDTNQISLSNDLLFDLFPETIDGFHELALVSNDSYKLAWDPTFPTLADADGDGLRSKLVGGADPDDSRTDSDSDGLGDGWEQNNGFDPTTADGDGDGLTDYWEAFFLTDPYEADSDGDGLTDSREALHPNWSFPYENSIKSDTTPPPNAPSLGRYAGGWEIVYAYNGATPLKSWVNAAPADFDTDNDGIDDLREEIYGYNPQAASALKVLSLHSTVRATSGSTTYPVPYATLGSTLGYTADITNELTDRWARGLLQAEFPNDIVRQTTELGALQPLELVSLTGSTNAANSGLSASGTVSLTLRSGAVIVGDDDRVLWLHLNEAHGATTFTDSSVYEQASRCIASCPTANGDYLAFSPTVNSAQQLLVTPTPSLTPDSFSVGMWVKVNTPGTITLYRMDTVAGGRGETNFAIDLTNTGINLTVQKSAYATNQTVANNRWNHIMVTYDRSSNQTTLYVNGSQNWQQATSTVNYGSLGFNFLIGQGSSGSNFDLDEIEVYDRVLDADEVEQLFGQPVLEINFATLSDDSPSGNSLTCAAGSTCPSTSSYGGSFSQKQYVNASGSALDFSGDAFTFSAWIKPQTRGTPFDNGAVSAYNSLVGAYPRVNDSNYDWQGVFGAVDSSNHLKVAPTLLVNPRGQMRLFMGGGTHTCHLDTAEGLITYGTWQHVTVSFDGETASFYINGNLVAQSNRDCANIVPANLGQITVGRGSALGTLYWHYVSFSDGADAGNYELRINVDSDSSSGNIWQDGTVTAGGSHIGNILKAYFIPDDNSHWWRFWDDDGTPFDNTYHSCSVGCDDSFVNQTVHNYDAGSNSTGFKNVDIAAVDWAQGTLYWTLSNDFFVGNINELKAYTRAFSAEDALKLYESSYDGMFFTFDEPPGSNTFADVYDDGAPASCDLAGGSCPDSGIAGINSQAADFNGTTDYLQLPQVDLLKTLNSNFTIAAWIKPDDTNGIQRILAASRQHSANGFGFGLTGNKLLFTTFSIQDYVSSATVTPGAWQHVAVVFDDSYRATFYVNGVAHGTVNGPAGSFPADTNSDDPYRIGSTTAINGAGILEMFDGRIDDLVIERRALDTAGVQRLMASAPILTLHLDEDTVNLSYANDANTANPAVCASAAACPAPGDHGQIRESAVFDGQDDILSVPMSSGLSQFTVALWVNPTEIKNNYQPLVVRENASGGQRNFGLFIHPDSMDIHMSMSNSACSAYVAHTVFNNPLLQHQWNYVVFTFDGTTQRLYINGTQRGSNVPGSTPCLASNPVKIGREVNAFTPFEGGIDEVSVYSRALSGLEVADAFAYQSAWFDVKETHPITIDNDNPTVSLDLANPYLAAGETVFKIAATDPTSEVVRVQYEVEDGISNPPVLDAVKTNGVWTFSYDFEKEGKGEGNYLIVLVATDSVGNTGVAYKTVYVDTRAPAGITGSLPPHAPTDGILFWSNILIEDNPGLDGATSGIDNTTVMVTVRDRLGNILGAPTPATESRAGNYTAQIPFPFEPYGLYTFSVTFSDLVGNRGSFDQPVFLESHGPHADVMLHATTNISAGMTLRGIASDVEHIWQSRGLQLHFEDGASPTEFLDVSGNEFVAKCAAPACPTVQTSGGYDNAVSFDGTNDVLTLADNDAAASTGISASLEERLGMTNSSFTVMAWVNASSIAGFRPLMGTSPFEDDQELFIGFIGGAPAMSYGNHSVATAETVPAGEWHHVAWRFDMDAREQALFIDGELVSTQANRDSYTGSGNVVTIGQADPTNLRFVGLMDELVIYHIPVTDERIYDIANPVQSGLTDIEVRFRHIDDQGQLDDSGVWYEATFTSGVQSSIFRTWEFTVPDGLDGSYKIDLRATDTFGLEGRTARSTDRLPIPQNKRFVPGVWTGTIGDVSFQPSTTVFLPYIAMP